MQTHGGVRKRHFRVNARSILVVLTLVLAPASAGASEPCYFSQISGGAPNCGLQLDGTPHCWGSGADYAGAPPPGTFTFVSAGRNHACGLRADSSVECWGEVCGLYYGCYMSFCTYAHICTDIGGSNVPPAGAFSQISAGESHDCGVRPDGSIECWGGNHANTPGLPPAGTYASVESGFGLSCALDTAGEIHCWGINQNGATNPPAPDTVPPIDVFTDLSTGGLHSCALRGGTVECWGHNTNGQASPLPGMFTQIAASAINSCGMRADGSIECWGNNGYGESTPPGGAFVQLAGNCGLRADGTAECWGQDAGLVECSTCGNSVLADVEECDDGNLVDDDGCDSNCTVTACGNGILTSGEICDDGNLINHDGCGDDCTISLACGDGSPDIGEWCDDGNTVNGDGCENDCTISPPVCGDGDKEGDEDCDDGNAQDNDGCENDCTISPPVCGNAVLTVDEECDDGNLVPDDGCDADCMQECPQVLPDPGFELAGASRSSLSIVDSADDSRDSLQWKWRGLLDYGDLPGQEYARYQLCLYPDGGPLAGAIRLRGATGWTRYDTYKDPDLTRSSLKLLQFRVRLYSESKLKVKAAGLDLPDGLLPTASYTIALCESLYGNCWTSSFASGDLDAGRFKARSPE